METWSIFAGPLVLCIVCLFILPENVNDVAQKAWILLFQSICWLDGWWLFLAAAATCHHVDISRGERGGGGGGMRGGAVQLSGILFCSYQALSSLFSLSVGGPVQQPRQGTEWLAVSLARALGGRFLAFFLVTTTIGIVNFNCTFIALIRFNNFYNWKLFQLSTPGR